MASTELAVQKQSLIRTMAERFQIEPERFKATVIQTCFPNKQATDEQLAMFLMVANQYELNPFTKEIYAFPNKGGVVPIVGVDGWTAIINRQPDLDGIEFIDHRTEDGKVTAITCKIYRKNRRLPTEVTEYLSECKRDTDPWKQMPGRMLRHKALIQCARYAFSLSGIYDEDEAARIVDRPAGELELEANSSLLVKANLPEFKTTQESATTSVEAGLSQVVHFEVGKEKTFITGQTRRIESGMKKLGAVRDEENKRWTIPAAFTSDFTALCANQGVTASEVSAGKPFEAGPAQPDSDLFDGQV